MIFTKRNKIDKKKKLTIKNIKYKQVSGHKPRGFFILVMMIGINFLSMKILKKCYLNIYIKLNSIEIF